MSRARLAETLDRTLGTLRDALDAFEPELVPHEVGTVHSVGEGIARVTGLPSVKAEELVRFPGGLAGMALDLQRDHVGVVLLDPSEKIEAGDEVRRTGRVLDVPVGEALLGRVVDALGRPLDDRGSLHATERWPIEREAPPVFDRAPVEVPLQTGVKVVDTLIPVGRGQRELIAGDRQTGKTAIALDAMIHQAPGDLVKVYCAVAQRSASVARVIADLEEFGAMEETIVVVAGGDDPPGLQFVAPYAATTMAEWFRDAGRDVLIVYDDLTRHARAYRELSLLLRRPPGREAYPGDIFYIHARLLERATRLAPEKGGGSLTAFPVVETQAQNISAYIPTNLISITDGQIYLSPRLHQKGILPAVDVGRSVSRVGGKAQRPAYRSVASDLRLAYAQFEELEAFARFGTTLDEETRGTLERGRRVREVLKQPQYEPIPAGEQIAVLLAAVEGLLDRLPIGTIAAAEREIRAAARDRAADVLADIEEGEPFSEAARERLSSVVSEALQAAFPAGDEAAADRSPSGTADVRSAAGPP